jgi:hypothetical protein
MSEVPLYLVVQSRRNPIQCVSWIHACIISPLQRDPNLLSDVECAFLAVRSTRSHKPYMYPKFSRSFRF